MITRIVVYSLPFLFLFSSFFPHIVFIDHTHIVPIALFIIFHLAMAESNEEPVAVGSIDLSINIGDLSGWPQLFQLLQGHDKFRKIVRVGKDYLRYV